MAIEVKISVDRTAAILAGYSVYGDQIVECDPATLPTELRAELAKRPVNNGIIDATPLYSANYPIIATATPEAVPLFLAACAKERVEIEAQNAEKSAREKQKLAIEVGEYLDWALNTAKIEDFIYTTRGGSFSPKAMLPGDPPYGADINALEVALAQRLGEAKEMAGKLESERLARMAEAKAQAKAEAEAAEAKAARKKSQIADWVAKNGTENQRGRLALGLLPESEIVDLIREEAYTQLSSFARYKKIDLADIEHTEDCYIDRASIDCEVVKAEAITAEEFDLVEAIKKAMPAGAQTTVLIHRCACGECGSICKRKSVRVAITVGEFDFSREYALGEE